jgi:hypothetical protein
MPETLFATTLIVCLKAGVALLVSAGTADHAHQPAKTLEIAMQEFAWRHDV